MKKALLCVVVAIAIAPVADAAKVWEDMSWWGNTGATPEPVPDATRSGYWWWPTQPASNAGDAELWGNRGIVYYHAWQEPAPPEPPAPPPPPEEEPKVTRDIPVFNNVLFDFDKATLKPEGKAEVDKVISELKDYPDDTVTIEGHTCDIGSESYNMGLGQRRANAVRDYMVQNGIDPNRIETVSYGESDPAVANTGPANRKLNRRAVFEYHMGD